MMRIAFTSLFVVALLAAPAAQSRYKANDGKLRVALAQQPLGQVRSHKPSGTGDQTLHPSPLSTSTAVYTAAVRSIIRSNV